MFSKHDQVASFSNHLYGSCLDHDEAALTYACQMANKLRKSGRDNDTSLVVSVSDECRSMIFSVPLLAAYA